MRRSLKSRPFLTLTMLCLAIAVACPPLAQAATPAFGPARQLPSMGARCSGAVLATASAAFGVCERTDSSGATQRDRLSYFAWHGSSWQGRMLTLYGVPWAAAADATGTYLLYESRGSPPGATILKRDPQGAYSIHYLGTPSPMAGAGLVVRGGKWWAVWTAAPGAGHEYALYESGTLYGSTPARQITNTSDSDVYPALVLRPQGGLVLMWSRVHLTSGGDTQDLRVAVRSDSSWAARSVVQVTDSSAPYLQPSLSTDGDHVFAGWIENFRPVVASDESGRLMAHRFATRSCARSAVVAASSSVVTAAVTLCSAGDRPSGSAAGGQVTVLERDAGSWTFQTLDRAASGTGPTAVAAKSREGRAEILVVEPNFASYTRSR
jgi:hypothetical protein